MKGWFDAFRNEGGPTLYSYSNRTPVMGDSWCIGVITVFASLYLIFLITFPGIRKERFSTFISVTVMHFVGLSIALAYYSSSWHVSQALINTEYRSFSPVAIDAKLGVYIGLSNINVTLESSQDPEPHHEQYHHEALSDSNSSMMRPKKLSHIGMLIDYNERFSFAEAHDLHREMKEALAKGLPYPILTVLEYFSVDDEGFTWGRMYRMAGYYVSWTLIAAFVSYSISLVMLIAPLPFNCAIGMLFTGFFMLSANAIYYLLLPTEDNPLVIHIEDQILTFDFGWCFWLVLVAGSVAGGSGVLLLIFDWLYPHKFSTIFECDYDTPFDRHIIIEESFKGKSRRSLEDPIIESGLGIGRKILRTLSSKSRTSASNEKGLVNSGFEMDAPKSPWMNNNRGNRVLLGANKNGNTSLIDAMASNPQLARLAQPNHVILGISNGGGHVVAPPGNNNLKSPKSVSFRRQSTLQQHFDIPKRPDDSEDASISSSEDETDLRPFEDILDKENFPKPRLIPRVSAQSQQQHRGSHSSGGSGSRRGSNESSNSENRSISSFSEFDSRAFQQEHHTRNS